MPRPLTRTIKTTKAILALTLATFPFQNCGEGFHLDPKAVDMASASSDPSDLLAPNVAILSPLQGAYVKSAVTISGVCEAGLPVQLSINGGTSQSLTCNGSNFSSSLSLTQTDGPIELKVEQIDVAGNQGSKQVTVTKDTAAPVLQFSAPAANAQLTSQALTVSGSCESGLNVTIAGNALSAPAQVACVNSSFQAPVGAVSVNGTYTLSLQQTDAAGNQGSASRSITLALPAGTPVIKFSSPAANSLTKMGITITGTCVTGLAVQISGMGISQASQTTCTAGAFSAAVSFSNGDGTKNIMVAQTNAQSQMGQDSRSFILDTTAPAVSILTPAAGTQNDVALTVGGSCETGLNVAISGTGAAASASVPCAAATFQASVTFSAGAGAKTITASQTDAIGNVGINSRTFERIAPILDGKVLYANNCSSCHGALVSSTKINRTAQQITNAIATQPQMNAIKLSTDQVAAIAQALFAAPPTVGANYALDGLKVSCNVVGESQAYHTLKLLSDFELKNTLKDIFTSTLFNALFEVSIDPATQIESSSLDAVPKRRIQDSLVAPFLFSKGATTVTAEFLKTYDTTIWNAVQKIKTLSSAQRTQFFTSYVACYNDAALTDDCISQFISAFGLSVYRRKILTTEVTQLKASVVTESVPLNKLYYIVYGMLMAPDFIYHYEVNGTNANNMLVLDQYTLASRISYLITGSTPDKKMLQLATDGKLGTAVDINSAVDYLVATYPNKVKENIWQFASEWLRLTSSNFPNSPRANALSNSFINLAGGEGSTFRKAALQEMKDMFGYYTVDKPGTFTDLLTSDKSFTSNAKLAQVYNTTVWSAGQTPPTLPTTERVGFLTKAAMTIHGGDRNNPFATGGTIFKHVLCRQFGSPGGIFTPAVIDPSIVRTTRQHYEALVPRGSSCISCHGQLEPFGMPFEQFDIFSRNRNNIEKVYDDNGTFLADKATDTTQSPTLGSQTISVDNAVTLVNRINESKEAHVCFATQIYRNHFGRLSNSDDACTLSRIAEKASANGSVIDILKALAIDASFKQRRMN
jgi:mono/diheme cytochrome c family protein